MKKFELIYKQVGETPLEALERFRAEQIAAGHAEYAGVPMTYAGRLDPMAEGKLLILIGEECKQKEKYLGLDKEYEVEIVYGIETDTYDALGLAVVAPGAIGILEQNLPQNTYGVGNYMGRFIQEYPPYSSRTINGRQLHQLARAGELPASEEMPTKEVEIYSIELLKQEMITPSDLKTCIFTMIDTVTGDFRQTEIKERWNKILNDATAAGSFQVQTIRVKCSSGTYMRSLAHRMGGFTLTIRRTQIFMK